MIKEERTTPAAGQTNGGSIESGQTQGDYTIDTAAADYFLTLLDEQAESFTFQTFADSPEAKAEEKERERNKQPKRYAHVFHGTLEQHAPALDRLNSKGAGIFVTVNQTDLKGRKADNITAVRAVFSDTDGAPLDPITRAELEPHFIVESSPDNWHAYWLTDDLPLAQFEGVQRRVADRFGTDSSVTDLPRVLRLPGFYHRKGEPFMVKVVQESGGLPFAADKILATFPPLEKEGTSKQARALEISEGDEILKALSERGLVRSKRPDSAYNVACPFEDEHTTESGQTETVYYPANTGGFKTANFKCMHAHCTDRRLNDYRERLGLCEVPESRTYSELLEAARAMDQDTEPDDVDSLVIEAKPLKSTEKRRIHEAIKKTTGFPLSTLKAAERDSIDPTEDPDDLALAQGLVAEIGRQNVLSAQTFVWQWRETGVWKKQEERSVKQWVQHYLSEHSEDIKKSNVDSVADLFKTEIYSPDHEFDIGPAECVNTLNGELMLMTELGIWTLEPHNREHYRTTQVPVEYDPKAQAPRFIKFLSEIFSGDHDAGDKSQALLEMMGYSLMAHCRHEKFVILVGLGANGKSVLLSLLEALCGMSNVAGVQPSQFGHAFQRAHLHGKLVNIVTEVKQGEVIDDASLKGIVSGEPSTVEHKFKDPFVMRPFSTCWFGTNHMPHTRDFSDALFRRALVVEFNNVFKPELGNCDPMLKGKLMEELPGILSLALDAYANALEVGFTMPESCRQARDKWRMEADQVAQFVDAECSADHLSRIEPLKLFNAYRVWAGETGIHKQLAMPSFVERLERLGFERKKSNGSRYIVGISCQRAVNCGF